MSHNPQTPGEESELSYDAQVEREFGPIIAALHEKNRLCATERISYEERVAYSATLGLLPKSPKKTPKEPGMRITGKSPCRAGRSPRDT